MSSPGHSNLDLLGAFSLLSVLAVGGGTAVLPELKTLTVDSYHWLSDDQFFAFGWRIPFLASAVLVIVGLYVRLTITETPVFRDALERRERVKVPIVVVFRDYRKTLVIR